MKNPALSNMCKLTSSPPFLAPPSPPEISRPLSLTEAPQLSLSLALLLSTLFSVPLLLPPLPYSSSLSLYTCFTWANFFHLRLTQLWRRERGNIRRDTDSCFLLACCFSHPTPHSNYLDQLVVKKKGLKNKAAKKQHPKVSVQHQQQH